MFASCYNRNSRLYPLIIALTEGGIVFLMMIVVLESELAGQDYNNGIGQECRNLLNRCLETQAASDKISMRIDADEELVKAIDENSVRKKKYEFFIRRDGDLLDISGKRLLLDKLKNASSQIRVVVNKQYYIHHDTRILMPKKPSGAGFSEQKRRERFASWLTNAELGTYLDGYLLGFDGKRVVEWMLGSNQTSLRGDERLDTVLCKVIESHTQQGKVALWLDEVRGCLPLKMFCVRKGSDFLGDKPISQQPKITYSQDQPPISLIEWTAQVSIHRIIRIGNYFVPTEGQIVETEKYDNGKETVNVKTVRRSDIRLNPSFEGTDAFVSDLKDGARLTNLDDPHSGVFYEWRGGKVVRAFSDFAATAEGKWSDRSMLAVLSWLALGVVLLIVSLWYIWRYKMAKG